MDNELEKLKQERDEILAKALKVTELVRGLGRNVLLSAEEDSAVAAIEALRPKPKPLECWLEFNQRYGFEGYWISEPHKDNLKNGHLAVRMREVLPAPKWERWEVDVRDVVQGGERVYTAAYHENAVYLADLHNAEMERLAAHWEGGSE